MAGEVRDNVYVDARNAGIVLIDAGHFDTENLIVPLLEQRLRKAFPGVMVLPSETKPPALPDGLTGVVYFLHHQNRRRPGR